MDDVLCRVGGKNASLGENDIKNLSNAGVSSSRWICDGPSHAFNQFLEQSGVETKIA